MPDAPPPPLDFEDADRLLAALWSRLASKPFRTQTLSTVGLDGSPQARSVIVRDVDAAGRAIACHTDRTSPKVAELRRDPRAAWLAWDAAERLQLRVTSTVSVHLDDALADAMWASQPASSLAIYRVERASSTPIDRPTDAGRRDAPDRSRFAVLRASASAIEWLSLADADAHRRGRFTFDASGAARHAWLVP